MTNVFKRAVSGILGIVAMIGIWQAQSYFKGDSDKIGSEGSSQYVESSREFAESLMNGTYQSAANFVSSHMNEKITAESLQSAWEKALQTYGTPIKIEVSDNGNYHLDSQDQSWLPADVTQEMIKRWTIANFALEVDEQGEITRCFAMWMVWVEEEGAAKILHYYMDWCD